MQPPRITFAGHRQRGDAFLLAFTVVGDVARDATVIVRADGRPWFPHPLDETGQSTGDRELDRTLAERARQVTDLLEAASAWRAYTAPWPRGHGKARR